jgi:hypothetical protein
MYVQAAVNKSEYSAVMASISKRRGVITNTEIQGALFIMSADVPLSKNILITGIRDLLIGFINLTFKFNPQFCQ